MHVQWTLEMKHVCTLVDLSGKRLSFAIIELQIRDNM